MSTPAFLTVHDVRVAARAFIHYVRGGNAPPSAVTPASLLAAYTASVHAARAGREVVDVAFRRIEHTQAGQEVRVYSAACTRAGTGAGGEDRDEAEVEVRTADAEVAGQWLEDNAVHG